MKKTIYILLALLIVGGAAFFLINRDDVVDDKDSVDSSEVVTTQLNWSEYFPEEVLEYTDGQLKEISEVDPEMSRFKDEVVAIVEGTTYEAFDTYMEELITEGWSLTYQTPQRDGFLNVQLSLEDRRISANIDDLGVLTLSTYISER